MNKSKSSYHSTYRSKADRSRKTKRNKLLRNLLILMVVIVTVGIVFSKGNFIRFLIAFAMEIGAVAGIIGLAAYLRAESRNRSRTAPKRVNYAGKSVERADDQRVKRNIENNYTTLNKKKRNFDWILGEKNEAAAVKEVIAKEAKEKSPIRQIIEERKFTPYRSPFEPINPVQKPKEELNDESEADVVSEPICDGEDRSDTCNEIEDKKIESVGMSEDFIDEAEENAAVGINIMFDGPDNVSEAEENENNDADRNTLEQGAWEDENTEFVAVEESCCGDFQEREETKEIEEISESTSPYTDESSDEKLKVVRLIRKVNGTVVTKTLSKEPEAALPKRKLEIVLPSPGLLKKHETISSDMPITPEEEHNANKLVETLASFGVGAKVINVSKGPAVTRYELQPNIGVKVSKIVNLADDIALNLAATAVRIEAPIPGKAAVGIEIPNKEVTSVLLRDVIESEEFTKHSSKLAFAVGKDISGNTAVADIAKMPHLLIAGATGSGKSVCINTLIASILYKAAPSEVRLLMIDPKVVELNVYNGIPHLLIPVVTDPKKAAGALNWAIQEMINRYKLFAENNVRDLKGYNNLIRDKDEGEKLPQIVIIIDELADLMMVAPNDVEDCICRLAQMARAAGMHLVIATQRPSVDVITGVIKANIPSRISFAVTSQVDSRTILDMAGAEKLLGRGDMLFSPIGEPKPIRVQGAFISDKEVEAIVDHLKSTSTVEYDQEIMQKIEKTTEPNQVESDGDDELLQQAIELVIDCGQASSSLIQRKFKVGYARAARIVDQMEAWGVVSSSDGSKPRKILVTKQEWEELNA